MENEPETEVEVKFDSKLPKEYFDSLKTFAREFHKRRPLEKIDGLKLDAQPRWRFDNNTHYDAGESIFVARNLEFIRPGVYAKKYPLLKWMQFVPTNTGVDTGAEAYTVEGSDYVGEVKVAKLPSADVAMTQQRIFQATMGFFSMTEGYTYNLQEVRNAIFQRRPLAASHAMNVRNLMERKLDDVALLGESTMAVKGLFTLSGTQTYTVPAVGAGGLTTFESKSADDILADLNGPIDQVIVSTNEVEIPDAMIIAVSRDRLISNKRMGDGSDAMVKRYFLANQEFIKKIDTSYKLESNAAWTGKRSIYYQNNEECLEMVIPQPFEQLQPVAEHFTVTTLCHMRTGGIALHKPQAVIYSDNT